MGCETCAYYVPHVIYPYVGYCSREGRLVINREGCEKYTRADQGRLERAIAEAGWAYCITCREPIYSVEDLREHMAHGHAVSGDFLEDQVATEESHAAD